MKEDQPIREEEGCEFLFSSDELAEEGGLWPISQISVGLLPQIPESERALRRILRERASQFNGIRHSSIQVVSSL